MFGPVPKGPSEGGEVLVNNNKNKFPALSGYMSNTVHKTGERSFKEERRDVMTMNKFFTGLIALVAGVALSAGSAFATKGHTVGDASMMKLVPYYETGPMKATIIGIQNMSPQEADTAGKHAAVAGAKRALEKAQADPTTSLDVLARLEKNVADAEAVVNTEHIFVMVNVYDAMGMMMDSKALCLAEHQFGTVVLQGPASEMMDSDTSVVFSMDDGDISAYGYVEVMAESTKYTSCTAEGGRTGRGYVRVVATADGTTAGDTPTPAELVSTKAMIAAWTIIQDVGDGFFGTEVPTSTISRMADMPDTDMDESMMTNCYNASDAVEDPEVFNMSMCGLIPERHDNSRVATGDAAGDLIMTGEDGGATARANAIARYDAGDESMVYVWLAEGMDTENTHPSNARMLDVVVKCEDGTVMTGMDQYGDPTDAIAVAAPGMLTMIDPTMGDVGDNVAMCTGDRGVLRITIPDGSKAGAVFSHVTQMGGHYRMNFPGYSKADPTSLPAP
jgi:hypothetical protein